MQAYLWPFLFTMFVWWFTTGVIIYLDGLARKTFKWTIAGMTALLAVALFGIAEVAQTTTDSAAYLGFTFGSDCLGLAGSHVPDRGDNRPAQDTLPARRHRFPARALRDRCDFVA